MKVMTRALALIAVLLLAGCAAPAATCDGDAHLLPPSRP